MVQLDVFEDEMERDAQEIKALGTTGTLFAPIYILLYVLIACCSYHQY